MKPASLAEAAGIDRGHLSRRMSGAVGHPDEIGVLLCAVAECSTMMRDAGVKIDDDYEPTLARLLTRGRRAFEKRKRQAQADALKARVAEL